MTIALLIAVENELFYYIFRHGSANIAMWWQHPPSLGNKWKIASRAQIIHIRGEEQESIVNMCRVFWQALTTRHRGRQHLFPGPYHLHNHRWRHIPRCRHAKVSRFNFPRFIVPFSRKYDTIMFAVIHQTKGSPARMIVL